MSFNIEDNRFMQLALEQAQQGALQGEVPVGAVLVKDGQVLAKAFNTPITNHDPTAHAEICVLREAAKEKANYRLPGTTLYVTLEPCTMCMGALLHARVHRIVFGTREPRAGAIVSQLKLAEQTFYNHRTEVAEGLLGEESAALLKDFFSHRR